MVVVVVVVLDEEEEEGQVGQNGPKCTSLMRRGTWEGCCLAASAAGDDVEVATGCTAH